MGVVESELLSFAARVIEKTGGVTECHADRVAALFPPEIAEKLEVPEELVVGGEETPLGYGTPLFERLVKMATEQTPVTFGYIEVPYLKKSGFEQVVAQDLTFDNGRVLVRGRAEARTSYMVLYCTYVAMSDERKEGLVRVAIHESSGAVIEGFEQELRHWNLQPYQTGQVPPHFPVHLKESIQRAMARAEQLVAVELQEFVSSMRRRLVRDVNNTKEYYEALAREMEATLNRSNLSESQRRERLAKISELPVEAARKIADLQGKYNIEVRLRACAARRLLVEVVQLVAEIQYKNLTRSLPLLWNPVSRRVDPLVCDHCGATVRRMHVGRDSTRIHLLCPDCSR